MRRLQWTALIGQLALLAPGCASVPIASERLDALVNENVALAQKHLDQSEATEAGQVIQAGAALNPNHPGVRKIQEAAQSDQPSLAMPSALGVNRSKRAAIQPSLARRLILYLPDRLLDILDVIGFDVHVGPGVYLNTHLTRAFQLGAGARAVAGLGWHTKRSFGLLGQAEAGMTLLASGAQTYSAGQVGTSGIQAGVFNQAGVHRPTDPVYQRLRDYWAFGVDTTLVLVGLAVDVHPVELVDFVGGLILKDPLRDDFGGTKRLRLTAEDRSNIQDIITVLRKHRQSVVTYRQSKEAAQPVTP